MQFEGDRAFEHGQINIVHIMTATIAAEGQYRHCGLIYRYIVVQFETKKRGGWLSNLVFDAQGQLQPVGQDIMPVTASGAIHIPRSVARYDIVCELVECFVQPAQYV